ncbi:unnamed protein product [Ambrosiozyma monospora]|uniref:Unnamed protein product n=1 Tax=Ambrosiozyma monospora TaxID=43982 RepID=A0ACB5TC21_AMBMO|nr:unnamed protein product [Ambrosiozyma monospora]
MGKDLAVLHSIALILVIPVFHIKAILLLVLLVQQLLLVLMAFVVVLVVRLVLAIDRNIMELSMKELEEGIYSAASAGGPTSGSNLPSLLNGSGPNSTQLPSRLGSVNASASVPNNTTLNGSGSRSGSVYGTLTPTKSISPILHRTPSNHKLPPISSISSPAITAAANGPATISPRLSQSSQSSAQLLTPATASAAAAASRRTSNANPTTMTSVQSKTQQIKQEEPEIEFVNFSRTNITQTEVQKLILDSISIFKSISQSSMTVNSTLLDPTNSNYMSEINKGLPQLKFKLSSLFIIYGSMIFASGHIPQFSSALLDCIITHLTELCSDQLQLPEPQSQLRHEPRPQFQQTPTTTNIKPVEKIFSMLLLLQHYYRTYKIEKCFTLLFQIVYHLL